MILITTATSKEFSLVQDILKDRSEIFPLTNKTLLHTGIGRTNSFLSLVKFITKEQPIVNELRIVNIGFCGSSVQDSHLGDIVKIANFIDGDRNKADIIVYNDLYPEFNVFKGPTLVTSSRFVSTTKPEEQYYYDMEAFDQYAFCREFNLGFDCIKIVSDFCNLNEYNETLDSSNYHSIFEKALLSVLTF